VTHHTTSYCGAINNAPRHLTAESLLAASRRMNARLETRSEVSPPKAVIGL
jgi:hypothetical protein